MFLCCGNIFIVLRSRNVCWKRWWEKWRKIFPAFVLRWGRWGWTRELVGSTIAAVTESTPNVDLLEINIVAKVQIVTLVFNFQRYPHHYRPRHQIILNGTMVTMLTWKHHQNYHQVKNLYFDLAQFWSEVGFPWQSASDHVLAPHAGAALLRHLGVLISRI